MKGIFAWLIVLVLFGICVAVMGPVFVGLTAAQYPGLTMFLSILGF